MVGKSTGEKEGKVIKIEPIGIEVFVPFHLRGGSYSNLANITKTEGEVVLDFISVNPNDKPPGTLVGRIVLSKDHAERLLKALEGILKKGKLK